MRIFPLLLATLLIQPVTASATAKKPAEKPIEATDSWSPPSLKGSQNGVAYLTIVNHGNKENLLLSADSPVAERVEIHTQEMQGDIVRMKKLESLPVPGASSVSMESGGLHLMLMQLRRPLKEGETFPLTLQWQDGQEQKIQVPVRSMHAEKAANTNIPATGAVEAHHHEQH